ncbi:MAG: hypothetical protein PVG57_05605, partial [Gammaproteobacteria bacterium]
AYGHIQRVQVVPHQGADLFEIHNLMIFMLKGGEYRVFRVPFPDCKNSSVGDRHIVPGIAPGQARRIVSGHRHMV